ncbi:cytochrome P450 94A1-like [Papaver somniferum]|uniref:cytochrome P450 94A1-like n=1 Tax=Papaver somniferum TaxID=3469 RepID=UPI000E6F5E28|nr:cytochrome P450 94A1-like [Papaver somniferum]
MLDLGFSVSWLILVLILPISIIWIISIRSSSIKLPKSYPLVGSIFAIYSNRNRMNQWMADVLTHCATRTFVIQGFMGPSRVWTANPENVKHILQTQFPVYPKGELLNGTLFDFLGTGIFNTDGAKWKFQRKLASHEFNTKSLRKFIEDVVKIELFGRLIPILETAAHRNSVLDLQDILQRFAFDNICKISFGFDPAYLSPSLDRSEFAIGFEDATQISSKRFAYVFPFVWKLKRYFDVGSEKRLSQATSTVREAARKLIRQKKQEMKEKSSAEATDLLSRFLRDDHLDDDFVIDIVISFILAGQDTTSAALTWFFWLVSCHPKVEKEILKEINEISDEPGYEDAKEMVYIHESLSESMRLYPPVPNDSKQAASDDVLPDGTIVKKGMRVIYSPYAMGRMDNLWGSDWRKFKPERWLEIDKATGKSYFVAKDSFTYPVFQAGPRICLGKEMAFLQMKMLVVEILRRFQVVPAEATSFEPVFVSFLTSKMKGGFPVKKSEEELKSHRYNLLWFSIKVAVSFLSWQMPNGTGVLEANPIMEGIKGSRMWMWENGESFW